MVADHALSTTSLVLGAGCELAVACDDEAVARAAADLRRDLARVLGAAPPRPARISVALDPALGDEEAWAMAVDEGGIVLSGGGPRGAIYALYHLAREYLGVDPLWFWKDVEPEPRDAVTIPCGRRTSSPAAYRLRGWFINDEDLLSEWSEAGGLRDIDYPFYRQVVDPAIIDRACEALLRLGGNLIIPGSFVDVRNPAEAELVRTCVRRGLLVSQHHVEPLGVSHFAFERYWRERGEDAVFSYRSERERVIDTWRDYVRRWVELAGDRVVWQLGLRGRGDRPVWRHDPTITPETAGRFISEAMATQWAIVRGVDPRPAPPATTTLWMEGEQLMRAGRLELPEGSCVVFADRIHDQQLGEDFHQCPRLSHQRYGLYWHPAVWPGPHLVQGCEPEQVAQVFTAGVEHGASDYAVINVANIREHVLGIEAAMTAMAHGRDFAPDAFLAAWAPPGTLDHYRAFLQAWARIDPWDVLTDGKLVPGVIRKLLAGIVIGGNQQRPEEALHPWPGQRMLEAVRRELPPAIARLEALVAAVDLAAVPARWRAFVAANLVVQARLLAGCYRLTLVLLAACDDPPRLTAAVPVVDAMLAACGEAERGRWAGWYRGDRKVGLHDLRRKLAALATALAAPAG